MDNKIKLEQDEFNSFNIKVSGLRWTVITLALASIGVSMYNVSDRAIIIAEEKHAQTEIMRQQLEVAKQQYVLDSLRYYNQYQK
ncbi:MAG: hypothetical protein KBS86_01995 [Proteobacteria bacterium]|nr:hypothetical protein [Candidatus Enterousia scatequi]